MKRFLPVAILAVFLGWPGLSLQAQEHHHPPPPPPPPPQVKPDQHAKPAAPPAKVLTPAEIVASVFTPATGTPARPSAAVVFALDRGKTIQTRTFGSVNLPTQPTTPTATPTTVPTSTHAPTTETVYEIGSITKGLTALLLADMALAGEVSLHDKLEKFLPEPANFPEAIREITLLQLATHASGLPRLPGNLSFGMKDPSNPYAHYGAKELQAFLYGYAPPSGRTTIASEYSNLGFGLLGYVLSLKAGTSYEALLKTRVLEPLGMRDTSIALSDDQRKRLAPGHAKGKAVSNWDLDAFAGAGGVRSTAADMAKLLVALMNPPDTRIGKAIKLALEPRGQLGAAKIGLGWITSAPPNGPAFTWHNGGTGGYRSFIGFTQDGKAGIVVLTNGSDESPDPLAVQALMKLAAR